MYQVLARRWRPQGFEEVVGQEHVTQTLKHAISSDKLGHAFVFSGPRGVGKTTTARILAKALNCEQGPTAEPCNQCASCQQITQGNSLDVVEIDGASNNSVDDIRDLREKVKYVPRSGAYKVYIIDEVHMLSGAAFNALLKTLEEPPAHVKFVFATTEPHKIPATILSRCQRYDFRRITQNLITQKLGEICKPEGVTITPGALLQVARAAEGSLRDAQSILDQIISSCGQNIAEADVQRILGLVEHKLIHDLTDALIRKDTLAAIQVLETIHQTGANLVHFYTQLLQYLRQLMLVKFCRSPQEILEITSDELDELKVLSEPVSRHELVLWVKSLLEGEELLKRAMNPRVAMEMSLLKLIELKPVWPVEDILTRLNGLEQALSDPAMRQAAPPVTARPDIPAKPPAPEVKAAVSAPPASCDTWPQIVAQIKQCKASLGVLLEDGVPAEVSSDKVVIAADGFFLNDENRKVIESVVQKLGKKLVVRDPAGGNGGGKAASGLSRKDAAGLKVTPIQQHALKEPIVEKALDVFQGRVIEVKDLRQLPGGELPIKGETPLEE